MKSFQPYADRAASRSYYEVPAVVIEDPERLGAWANAAIRAAKDQPAIGRRWKRWAL
jgi:TfoX/Sxy family transcriptional regulator of competence genes